jgi:GT2 family glycosyltransferase
VAGFANEPAVRRAVEPIHDLSERSSSLPMPELSVLIVNYNTWRECVDAVRTLRAHGPTRPDGSPMPFECIIVDNCSPRRDAEQQRLLEQELVALGEEQGDPMAGRLILHGENGGYSKGMNLAFAHSRGRWILVSNPDLVFTPGLIGKLQRHLERDPKAGIVVPKGFWDVGFTGRLPPNTLPTLWDLFVTTLAAFSPRLSRWHARRLARSWLRVWQAREPLALPMMSGCLFLVERGFFTAIGLFDERYPLYYEDADLSVKIRKAGRTVTQVPDAELAHFVNRSGLSDPQTMWQRHDQSRVLYYDKWYGWLGRSALRWSARLLGSRFGRRWARQAPHGPIEDLGESSLRPVITLPRRCERFLLLMSLDPRFFLSGGMLLGGDRWTPTDEMWQNFHYATFYYKVYDLSGGRFEELGQWRFRSLSHLGRETEEGRQKRAARAAAAAAQAPAPVLSVVVLSWNTQALTLACLGALLRETPRHAREIIVVDNGSGDGSADAIAREFPQVRLLRNADNRLYAAGNNQGAQAASGEFLCTLNSDTEVRPGALDQLVDFLRQNPGYAAAAPKLVDPDGAVQHACQRLPTLATALCFDSWWGTFWPGRAVQDRYLMRDFDHLQSRDVDQPPGACFVMRRAEWQELGGLDEQLALFYNDVDLSRRLRARGRRTRYLADAEVLHHRGASTRHFAKMLVVWHKNRHAYYAKHYGLVGRLWIRVCVRLRIWEEWWKIGRRHPHDKAARAAERAFLRQACAELWSS